MNAHRPESEAKTTATIFRCCRNGPAPSWPASELNGVNSVREINKVCWKMEINVLRELWMELLLLIGSCLFSCTASEDFLKSDHKHRTHKAAERANELWCYKCSTMDIDKEYCMNVSKNDSSLHQKCDGDIRACMVKRISYTTTTNGSSNKHKLWSLERNCSQKCEAGCIIIGERLKLYKCTSCCEGKNFCNFGSGASVAEPYTLPFVISFSLPLFIYLNS